MFEFRVVKVEHDDFLLIKSFPINGNEEEMKEAALKFGKEYFDGLKEKAMISCIKADTEQPGKIAIYKAWW